MASTDGISVTDMQAVAFKEAFDANVRAGFSEAQALYLVAAQVCENPGIAPGSSLEDPPRS